MSDFQRTPKPPGIEVVDQTGESEAESLQPDTTIEITITPEESKIVRAVDVTGGQDFVQVILTCTKIPTDEEFDTMSQSGGLLHRILHGAGWMNEKGRANFDFEIEPVDPMPRADGTVDLKIVYVMSEGQPQGQQ